MIASLGLLSVLVGVIRFVTRDDMRGLYVAVVCYLIAGILLQRREGQLSARSGAYYYRYAGRSFEKRIPDPAVTWEWRVRVVLFWLPWLLTVRGGDGIVFCLQSVRCAWQYALLGYDEPRSPEWRRRHRMFRTLPRFSDAKQAETDGRGPIVSGNALDQTVIGVSAHRR